VEISRTAQPEGEPETGRGDGRCRTVTTTNASPVPRIPSSANTDGARDVDRAGPRYGRGRRVPYPPSDHRQVAIVTTDRPERVHVAEEFGLAGMIVRQATPPKEIPIQGVEEAGSAISGRHLPVQAHRVDQPQAPIIPRFGGDDRIVAASSRLDLADRLQPTEVQVLDDPQHGVPAKPRRPHSCEQRRYLHRPLCTGSAERATIGQLGRCANTRARRPYRLRTCASHRALAMFEIVSIPYQRSSRSESRPRVFPARATRAGRCGSACAARARHDADDYEQRAARGRDRGARCRPAAL